MELTPLKKIVLAGGPGSGKTTAFNVLIKDFGDLVHPVPEAATHLIESLKLKPPFTGLMLERFQVAVGGYQECAENLCTLQAERDDRIALLSDRGMVEGAAYLPNGGMKLYEKLIGRRYKAMLARYTGVIFFDLPQRDVWNRICGNNGTRREAYDEAVALTERLRAVWAPHPNFVSVTDAGSWIWREELARQHLAAMLHEAS